MNYNIRYDTEETKIEQNNFDSYGYRKLLYEENVGNEGTTSSGNGNEENCWCNEFIVNEWLKKWKRTTGSSYDLFLKWFIPTYINVHNRAEEHKALNFKAKSHFIRLLYYLLAFQLIFLVYLFYKRYFLCIQADVFLAIEAGLILSGVLVLLPAVKKIDIYKNQETWARFRYQEEKLQMEMLREALNNTQVFSFLL